MVGHIADAPLSLETVNSVAYTWDDNGNLLSDGVNTYAYDSANRLTALSNPQSAFSFSYDGMGNRYRQIENGVPTTYTLDIAADMSQVLSDGEYTYLYGLSRFAQQSATNTDYFLPDALGSVRQIFTQGSGIGLTQSFDPFGNLMSQDGSLSSHYGFAGEWTDVTGLQHLRARYYAPNQGRFLTVDPFPGFLTTPASLNPYLYVLNNPVLYTDPSGEFLFLPLLAVALAGGVLGGLGYNAIQTYLSGDPCARWDWSEAALWGGAGLVLGAVLGVGIYGGWWVGTQVGLWGPSSITLGGILTEIVEVTKGEMTQITQNINLGQATGVIQRTWTSVSATYGQVNQYIINYYINDQYIATVHRVESLGGEVVHTDFKAIIIEGIKYLVK